VTAPQPTPEPEPTPQPEPGFTPAPTPEPAKRLTRSRDDRMLAGVCGGLAVHLGMDPTVVRLLAVLVGFLSVGTALVAYAIAAIVIPDADAAS
jgi:phage shock protein C